MRLYALILGARLFGSGLASPLSNPEALLQDASQQPAAKAVPSKLHGRFLHITDFHPDPFYKLHSSTEEGVVCHRGHGPAGIYGAETADCDSPLALVNATFDWIAENLRDTVDFVIWTGDSARHDGDEKIPRTAEQVLDTNDFIAKRFAEIYGNGLDNPDPTKDLSIPIVPTFGNNDILPHNILLAGPNKWLKSYTTIWKKFIPEEQRHGFERGGWFYTEVIPQKLAVFSLNTLYFFTHNAGVDGCAAKSEPGFEHMEWLRIQLQFMRERGMKAILMGHVPPARTDSKALWDESCWQKYSLWLRQYRDVVVGGVFGHMNVDHFLIQDNKDIDLLSLQGQVSPTNLVRAQMDEELDIASSADYLEELRDSWSKLPKAPATASWPPTTEDLDEYYGEEPDAMEIEKQKNKKGKKGKKPSKKEKYLKKIGGPWGERFSLSIVNPSIVPNYFPTLRIVEYNISGLDTAMTWANMPEQPAPRAVESTSETIEFDVEAMLEEFADVEDSMSISKKKSKKPKKPTKPQDPNLIVPQPPASTSPPGPAYSPQTFTFLGYVQYFANLTHINNEHIKNSMNTDVDSARSKKGKHHDKDPKNPDYPKPNPFKFEIEYSTFNDSVYGLKDLTMRSYLKLADHIGQYKSLKKHSFASDLDDIDDLDNLDSIISDVDEDDDESYDYDGKKDDKKNHKKCGKKCQERKKQKKKNRSWLTFVKRAFVSTLDDASVKSFYHLKDPKVPVVLDETAQRQDYEEL